MRFKPGQKIVCIKRNEWQQVTGNNTVHPKFNEAVTANGYFPGGCFMGIWYVSLVEYPTGTFAEYNFEPLIEDHELEQLLESISSKTSFTNARTNEFATSLRISRHYFQAKSVCSFVVPDRFLLYFCVLSMFDI